MYNLEFLRMINNGYDPLLILGKGGLGYHYDKPMVGYGLTPQQKKLVEGLTLSQAKELAQALGFEYEPEAEEEEETKKAINELNEVMDEQLPTDQDDAFAIMENIKVNDITMDDIEDEAAKIIKNKNFKLYWGLGDNYKQVKEHFEREKRFINKDTKLSDEEKEVKLMEVDDKQKAVDGLRERYQQYKELNEALVFELTKNPNVSKQNVNTFLSKLNDADDIVRDVVKLRYPTTIDGRIEMKIQEALAHGSEVMKEFEKEYEEWKKKGLGREPGKPGVGIGFEYALTNNPNLMEELTGEKHTNLQNTKDAYKQLGDKAKFFVADAVDDNTMWEFKYYASGGLDYNAREVEKDGNAPLTETKFIGSFNFVPYFIEDKGKYKLYNVWDTVKGSWVETNPKPKDYKALWSMKDGYWSYDIANDPSMKYDASWFKPQQNKYSKYTKNYIDKTIPDIGMVGTKPLLKMLPPTYNSTEIQDKKSYLIPKDKLKFLKPKMNWN